MRYFFRVEYDGAKFGGWQRQPNAVSIQELIESALSKVLRSPCGVTGAGRTDAGVHARGQGVHFDTDLELDRGKCQLSLNALLPPEVAISGLRKVDSAFHARFSALSREYKYSISQQKSPLLYKKVWMVFYKIDWDIVQHNVDLIKGTHEFDTFCASGSGSESTVCTVTHSALNYENGKWVFSISANRFIYKMVRSIVGTLVDLGRGYLQDTNMEDIIKSKDRKRAGATAPPYGLVLENVVYPESYNEIT